VDYSKILREEQHHHHWHNSPFWSHSFPYKILPDLIRFSLLWISQLQFYFTGQGRQPCVQPPNWRTRSPYVYPPVTGWPSYIPGTGLPFRRLLRLAGLRWRYSNPPPHRHVRKYTLLKTSRMWWEYTDPFIIYLTMLAVAQAMYRHTDD
jgi:hypothetical protein